MSVPSINTLCVQGGYTPGNGEPRQIPIIQSTTFKYDTADGMGKLFDLEAEGYFYSRLQNPTCDRVAAKITALEGGAAGMLTSSGQAANFFALFNICNAGDHIVSSSSIYGGTFNLIAVTMAKMGITTGRWRTGRETWFPSSTEDSRRTRAPELMIWIPAVWTGPRTETGISSETAPSTAGNGFGSAEPATILTTAACWRETRSPRTAGRGTRAASGSGAGWYRPGRRSRTETLKGCLKKNTCNFSRFRLR